MRLRLFALLALTFGLAPLPWACPQGDARAELRRILQRIGEGSELAWDELEELVEDVLTREGGAVIAFDALQSAAPSAGTLEECAEYYRRARELALDAGMDERAAYAGYLEAKTKSAAQLHVEAAELALDVLAATGENRYTQYLEIAAANFLRNARRTAEAIEVAHGMDREDRRIPLSDGVELARLGMLTRCMLDLGLTDRAALWIEREEALLANGTPDDGARIASLAGRMNHAIAIGDRARAIRLAEEAESTGLYDDRPSELAELRLGVVQARFTPGETAAEELALSRAELEALLDEGQLGTTQEQTARLLAAEVALDLGELDRCRSGLSDLSEAFDLDDRVARGHERSGVSADLLGRYAAAWARYSLAAGRSGSEWRPVIERLDEALEAYLTAWRSAPRRPAGIGFLHYPERREVVALRIIATRLADGEEVATRVGLELLLRLQAESSLARQLDAPHAIASADLRTALAPTGLGAEPERHGLLAYLVARSASFAFALDARGPRLFQLESAREIDARQTRHEQAWLIGSTVFDQVANERPLAEERHAAERLAEALFPEPLRAWIADWSALTVTGDGPAARARLSVLPVEGALLGTRVALDHLPSLPVGPALARRPRTPRERALLFVGGPPAGEAVLGRWPDLAELPIPAADRERLAEPFADSQVRFLIGEQAERASFLAAEPARFTMLHFFGHAVFDAGRERPVGLVFAADAEDDGVLWCEGVDGLRAPEAVWLTGCGSGREPARRGDAAVAGMAGAWLGAGASVVLVSNTDLIAGPTLALSESMLADVALGYAPSEALRRARARTAAERPGAAPYLWGGLRLIGLGQRALFEAAPGAVAIPLAVDADSRPAKAPRVRTEPSEGESSPSLFAWVVAGCALAASALGVLASRRRRA